ncbi:hypothetical protein GGQ74_001280 [Desulfobaculum xiamenense]|uniref:Uncharacterized protein n=1 Tax=Desulfobaculum xiamenense TaxID=995050 RepID=A0A846QKR0_9BACT|nr:hypothetical protein [Desulfobaculum xiamenense]NJB67640.1 hypothetical protein [Desulfobaculum xiamenense]
MAESYLSRDTQLERIVDCVLDGCEYALVIGDEAPAAAHRVAARHSACECIASEHDSDVYHTALNRAADCKNLYLHNVTPRELLCRVEEEKPYLFSRDVLVVLNAAGGGPERRFADEVSFVFDRFRAAFVLFVGCRVPGRDDFLVHSQRGRQCSAANLKPIFARTEHALYYPRYSVPAMRRGRLPGWGLAALRSNAMYEFPDGMREAVARVG